jgi:hypothetical protein
MNYKTMPQKADPVFKAVFGNDWDRLPTVMHRHYANRAFHDDVVTVAGHLDVVSSPLGRFLKPFFLLARTLVPYEGRNTPCAVTFSTNSRSGAFFFDRAFSFPGQKPYHFRSVMIPLGGNEVIERMGLGLCWRMHYAWDGEKVILGHKGYAWSIFGFLIPLPLGILIGKGYAEEIPLSDDEFSMMTEIRHPLWGRIFGYSGTFCITKDL